MSFVTKVNEDFSLRINRDTLKVELLFDDQLVGDHIIPEMAICKALYVTIFCSDIKLIHSASVGLDVTKDANCYCTFYI